MPRELRRRATATAMDTTELAPMADTREAEVEEFGPDVRSRRPDDDGIDDGFGPPTNGVPRRSPLPRPPSTFPVQPPAPGTTPTPGTSTSTTGRPGKRPLDVNLYATKKTVAQGMMDLALLTANANQLRYVLESGKYGNLGAFYYISLSLISLSIAMQLVIGVALIFLGRYNVSREHHAQKADTLNNWVVVGVFVITVINVFISSFAVEPFSGVDPVMFKKVMQSVKNMALPPDVTERVTERVSKILTGDI